MTSPEYAGEQISEEELFNLCEEAIKLLVNETEDENLTSARTLQLCHWMVETFGRPYKDGWTMATDYHDGIEGEKVPKFIQSLIMFEWQSELLLHGKNNLSARTQASYIEHDPVIPKWEEIEKLPTFIEQLSAIKNDSKILEGIIPTKVEVSPEVSISFEAGYPSKWGLEFIVSCNGVRLAPFGERGQTWAGLEFVLSTQDKQTDLHRTACELLLTCAKNDYNRTQLAPRLRTNPKSCIDLLDNRLKGRADIPISLRNYDPRPRNAVKDLLIHHALSA